MAITYHAGRRIQGLSTDKIVPTADYTDNFSTDNFTDTGTLQYVSGGVLNWASDRGATTNNTYDDMETRLGVAVDSTAFVIRYKQHITNITQGADASGEIIYWVLSTLTNESYSTAGDHVGFQLFITNSILNYSLNNKNGVGLAGGNGEVVFSTTPTTGDIWVEWIKNGDNFKINLYSDSTYSTLIESQNYTTSGVTGLRYFRVVSLHGTDPNHSVTGYLDDLQIFNGVTSFPSKPTNVQLGSRFEETDTRKIYYGVLPSVTFEDDFSSYTTQGSADSAYPSENTSYTRVNISNDTWEFNQPYSTSIHAYGSHDFGSGYISNNKWVLRFVVVYSTWNEGSSHNIVLSSGDHTVSSNTSGYQNIGVRFEDQVSPDAIYLVGTSNGTDRSSAGSGFNPSGGITTGTSYYVEIIRNVNSYTLNVRTGSHSGTLLGTDTGTVSGITSLRYLKISNIDWDVTNSTGDLAGAIDNIQLWNGVSSTTDFTWTEEV